MTRRVRSRFPDDGREDSQTCKVKVDTLENFPSDDRAVLIATPEVDIINFEVEVTFSAGSLTHKACLVLAHNGVNNYYSFVGVHDTVEVDVHMGPLHRRRQRASGMTQRDPPRCSSVLRQRRVDHARDHLAQPGRQTSTVRSVFDGAP